METLTIEVSDQKVIKLIEDLEELNLIRVVTKSGKLSSLTKKIKSPMSKETIDSQLNNLRIEWQRNI